MSLLKVWCVRCGRCRPFTLSCPCPWCGMYAFQLSTVKLAVDPGVDFYTDQTAVEVHTDVRVGMTMLNPNAQG